MRPFNELPPEEEAAEAVPLTNTSETKRFPLEPNGSPPEPGGSPPGGHQGPPAQGFQGPPPAGYVQPDGHPFETSPGAPGPRGPRGAESPPTSSPEPPPDKARSKGEVVGMTATVRDPQEGQQWTMGKVTKITVEERFKAFDRPGVRLNYHQGFGSEISKWDCKEEGAWRQTRSLLENEPRVFVKEIDGINVMDADPQVVTELWAARINGTESYTVTFTTEPAYASLCCYVVLCVLPWFFASFLACCTLPCTIYRIYMEEAFEETSSKMVEGSDQEPVPRFEDSLMSQVVEHPVTRLSLVAFGFGSVLLVLKTYIVLVPRAPSTSLIVVAPTMLFCGLTVFVAKGVKATKGNALLMGEALCPQGLTQSLKAEIRYMLYALAPSLLFVYAVMMLWLGVPFALWWEFGSSRSMFSWRMFTRYRYPLAFGPHLLVFTCLPHFLINSHILARIVEEHVRAVTKKIDDIHCVEKEKKGEGLEQLQLKVKEIHHACIRLPVDILPSLDCMVLPTLGFAACSWGWALMSVVMFVSGNGGDIKNEMDVPLVIAGTWMVLIFLPLGVLCLLPPASVSDAFDQLLDSLNRLRALEGMKDDVQVRLTESFIKESNRGQGLGFVFFGTVIHTRFIKALFLKIAASASLLFSVFYKVLASYTIARRLLSEVPPGVPD